MDIAGCTALVTGASRGIGLCFVETLFDRGAAVVCAAIRNPDDGRALRSRFGDRLKPLRLELTDPTSIDEAVATAAETDLLVCNAGRTLIGPFEDHLDADIRALFEVNLFGPLKLIRGLLPGLRARRGGLVCVLSMAALMPALQAEAYSASKAGLMMLAHGVRTAVKANGVRVSLVYPGFVDTPMAKSFDVKKASPRQVADRSLDGWLAGCTSIFPDVFAKMTHDALLHHMSRILDEPNAFLLEMVEEFVGRPDAGQ